MKRGHLPLTALRSFEAAGRLQSFTLAAEELHISQAAISRQVRELERGLGQALFTRLHRGVQLTADGQRLLKVLTRCFDDIDDALQASRAKPVPTAAVISCEPSFATCWLMPNLADFQHRYPQIDVVLDSDPRLVEFRAGQAPLAIRYSATATQWPRSESRHLADVAVFPVAAPALLEQGIPIRQPQDLARHTLLHEDSRDMWQAWFERAGASVANAGRGPVYTDSGLVLQALLRGQGVALMDTLFIADELRSGRLVRLFDSPPMNHGAYWLVARRFDTLAAPLATFAGWIGERLDAARVAPP